ncbi:MAG: hypothetical protein AB1424_13405 [Thermodesulfobacteriota bacterium]
MSGKEGFPGFIKKIVNWIEDFIIKESVKHLIILIIPSSLIPSLTAWIINPAKSFLVMALVTAPLTLYIILMIIFWRPIIKDALNKGEFINILGFSATIFIGVGMIFLLNMLIYSMGIGPDVDMRYSYYWNPIWDFLKWTGADWTPGKTSGGIILALFAPLAILYDLVGAYFQVYGWSLAFSPIVGVSAGWIFSQALESWANPLFIKIAEVNQAYPYELLKKKGRLHDDSGGVAVTLSLGRKTGKVNVKGADGKKIPFELVKKEDLPPETEIYGEMPEQQP